MKNNPTTVRIAAGFSLSNGAPRVPGSKPSDDVIDAGFEIYRMTCTVRMSNSRLSSALAIHRIHKSHTVPSHAMRLANFHRPILRHINNRQIIPDARRKEPYPLNCSRNFTEPMPLRSTSNTLPALHRIKRLPPPLITAHRLTHPPTLIRMNRLFLVDLQIANQPCRIRRSRRRRQILRLNPLHFRPSFINKPHHARHARPVEPLDTSTMRCATNRSSTATHNEATAGFAARSKVLRKYPTSPPARLGFLGYKIRLPQVAQILLLLPRAPTRVAPISASYFSGNLRAPLPVR